MNGKPVLAIQPRRLGDLILSIPLFTRLRALYSQSPLWIVAEPLFYGELAPLLPEAKFFPPACLPALLKVPYAAIVNLASSQQAANFCGNAQADLQFGQAACGPALRVHGFWQLYRHALTHNNRHNTFHWSNLDFLDLYGQLPLPQLPQIAPKSAGNGIVGLFLGASDAAKRPDAQFWARLARRLAREGYKPVLLGGKAETALGAEVSRHCGPRQANLCGQLSLGQLAATLKTLDLLITPDTGPMHLGNLVGAPVLNLSLGNVHAAETGPASPGQWVLRAAMSCVGCWSCQRPKLYCKAAFNPLAIGNVALAILRGENPSAILASVPAELELWRSGSDEFGLATLLPASPALSAQTSARLALDDFWRAAFISFGFAGHESGLQSAAKNLRQNHQATAGNLRARLGKILAEFTRAIARRQGLPDDFWRNQPQICRIFTGNVQMSLQNSDYSQEAWKQAANRAAILAQSLEG